MDTEDLIANFLTTDLAAVSTSDHKNLERAEIYQGQEANDPREHFGLRVKSVNRRNLGSKTGKPRLIEAEIEIHLGGRDKPREYELSSEARRIANEVVDRYDGASGGLARFRAGIPSLRFERCKATRGQVSTTPKNTSRTVVVSLAITVWE